MPLSVVKTLEGRMRKKTRRGDDNTKRLLNLLSLSVRVLYVSTFIFHGAKCIFRQLGKVS